MYNPVAQRRRAKCETVSSSLSEEPGNYDESPVSFTSEDLDTEALEMITQGRKYRRRKDNRPRRLRKPQRKPSWDDCTIIPPKEKPPRLNQNWGAFRKRVSGNRCSLHQTRSTLRKSQGGQSNKVRTRRVGDVWDNSIRPSKRSNLSNNKNLSTCFNRPSNLPAFPSTNNSLYKKKTVGFHPEPVAYAQVNYPGKNFQRNNLTPRKSFNTEKESSWCCPIKKIQRPAWDKSESCRPGANKSQRGSASCLQASDSKKVQHFNGSQRSTQADPWKSDSGRLTTSESKAFRYLAKRLLSKDFPDSYPIAPRNEQMFGKQNTSNRSISCFERPVSNCRSSHCVNRTADAWASAEGLQRRGRSKSRTSQNKHTPGFMPRSKSLGSYKFNDKTKDFGRRISATVQGPIDACTKAMLDMKLKENELLDRYRSSPSESTNDCSSSCSTKHLLSACKTRAWDDSSLSFNDRSYISNLSNPFYEIQTNDNSYMKKPYSWNPSRLERNISQNRYSYSSACSRNSLGTADGSTRHYIPPFNVTASSDLPWSSVLKKSVLQSRPSNSAPCSEARLMNKYLDDTGVIGMVRRGKTSTLPVRRESNVAHESNNSQKNNESQVRPSTPPWRKIEGIKNFTSTDYKLDEFPDKVSSALPMRRTFQNLLGGWKEGAISRYSSFSTDFTGLERILSSSEGGKNATDTHCNVLKGSTHSLDDLGSDMVSTGGYSKGIPSSTNICKFLNSEACQATSQKPAGKISSLMSSWQAEKVPGLRPVDSYLNEEKERLRRIDIILG